MTDKNNELAPPLPFAEACAGRYMFSMKVSALATPVGDAPEGARVDVLYNTGGTNDASTHKGAWLRDWRHPKGTGISAQQAKAVELLESFGGDPDALRRALGDQVATLQRVPLPDDDDDDDAPPIKPKEVDAIARAIVKAGNGTGSAETGTLWLGFDATLVSGSDWVLVSTDGVALLSGRFAFKSTDTSDEALVTMTISGAVDIADPKLQGKPMKQKFLVAAQEGFSITVAATFEAGRTAPSWAPDRMKRQAAGFWKYERLTRGEFLAIGTVRADKSVRDAESPFAIDVATDIYEVRKDT